MDIVIKRTNHSEMLAELIGVTHAELSHKIISGLKDEKIDLNEDDQDESLMKIVLDRSKHSAASFSFLVLNRFKSDYAQLFMLLELDIIGKCSHCGCKTFISEGVETCLNCELISKI